MFRGKRWYRATLKVGNTPSAEVLARAKEAAKYPVAFDGKDEILFAACLHPEEPGSHLRTRIWNRLATTICDIIARGIETDAMTPEDLFDDNRSHDGNSFLLIA